MKFEGMELAPADFETLAARRVEEWRHKIVDDPNYRELAARAEVRMGGDALSDWIAYCVELQNVRIIRDGDDRTQHQRVLDDAMARVTLKVQYKLDMAIDGVELWLPTSLEQISSPTD